MKAETADEESVLHAWDTQRVAVWVDVDRKIAPVVRALNKLPNIRTTSSCQGHLLSEYERRAYVGVSWTDLSAYDDLRRRLAHIEIEYQSERTARNGAWVMMYFDASLIGIIGGALSDGIKAVPDEGLHKTRGECSFQEMI